MFSTIKIALVFLAGSAVFAQETVEASAAEIENAEFVDAADVEAAGRGGRGGGKDDRRRHHGGGGRGRYPSRYPFFYNPYPFYNYPVYPSYPVYPPYYQAPYYPPYQQAPNQQVTVNYGPPVTGGPAYPPVTGGPSYGAPAY